jgi:uncharacterized cupin superfamily protein
MHTVLGSDPSDPDFAPEEPGEESLALLTATIDEEIERVFVELPDGVEELAPLDLVFFPTGPAGAHQIRNDSDARARVMMWSNVVFPTSTVYPDSDKVGVWTGDDADDVVVPRSARVDYFEGE